MHTARYAQVWLVVPMLALATSGLAACGTLGPTGGGGSGAAGGGGGTGGGGTGGDGGAEAMLRIRVLVDPTQQRLDNLGNPATMPAGHAAQSPTFHAIGIHYVELAPTGTTLLGAGEIVFDSPHTMAGGDEAIDFAEEPIAAPGEVLYQLPLAEVAAGTYTWLRLSVAYQEYDVDLRYDTFDITGRLASFVGENTYVESFPLGDDSIDVFANKAQGYWAFDTSFGPPTQGQAPAGATTVPNPLFASSPVPPGSCVVTGELDGGLELGGAGDGDVTLVVSLSTNESFEWQEVTEDGIFEPQLGETVVDMGLRGMLVSVE